MLDKSATDMPKITSVCFGKVVDYGVLDIANMGAAMAPAAADTLCAFLKDTGLNVSDFDLIATGDIFLGNNYIDCGHLIYSANQECMQGGSGAGCSASVFAAYIYQKLKQKKFKRVLLLATGALMSTTTNQQGDPIPAISHLIMVES